METIAWGIVVLLTCTTTITVASFVHMVARDILIGRDDQ